MANYFKAGSIPIDAGVEEMDVAGLAIGFTPVLVQISVRQPAGDDDLITAYVAGAPTADGFKVVFSAPTPSANYRLDWTAFSDGNHVATSEDTLAADYMTLKTEVAAFLGYDVKRLSDAQAQEIDRYIQSGVRQFYYPPMMDGVDPNHEWSFLKQTGSVELAAGVNEYLLPDGFGHFNGQLAYADAEARRSVPIIPYGDVLRMINSDDGRLARPRFAATLAQSSFGEKGQRKKLYVYPTPDRDYTLQFTCAADTGRIDPETRPYPCGGPMYAELVIESCLAVAEQKANDEVGAHTAKFNQLLVAMTQKDRKDGAQVFGRVGDPDGFRW